ncbi:MAG TPA: transposase [Candidatus Avalokitesvara rifleensis]|uniref:transposase n=1 Tax=Candidatus Avalokitesvara rifleensis TaxID=3367620 RepID=UPI0027143D88|nr:transposase [Candidatus Brocadiales bacterium]
MAKVKYTKNLRLKNYDYKNNGAYFVTLCTDFRRSLIQEKERQILEEELKKLQDRFSGIKLDYHTIMANHIHVIFIFDNAKVNLPRVVQTFKSASTLRLKKEGQKGKVFWQRNYYEHVIRNDAALGKIRQYIINNSSVERLKMGEIY